jgi:2,4'-dihydroxyacetophenone dioxygenase
MNLQAKLTRCSSLRIRQSLMIAFFLVEGGLIYLDKPENGGFAAYEDGFTLLELTRKHYREAGLDVRKLNLLVR